MNIDEENKQPLATVLMPVYNVEKYLNEAIDSILQQTFSNFRFLIINDGSSDESEKIILSYNDPRIFYIKNEKNLGLVGTLNRALDLIGTKYIIRMDSDDISVPERFEVLINYMESHTAVGVFSSALARFGDEVAVWTSPLQNDEIKAHLLFGSSIGHAPSIIRTEVLQKNNIYYRDVHPHMEDYDLWLRLKDLTDFANTPEVLYKYRVSNHNVTVQNEYTVIERKKKIFKWILESIGINATEEELLLHIGFGGKSLKPSKENIYKYRIWLDKIEQKNRQNDYFPSDALHREIESRWTRLFYFLPDQSFRSVLLYVKLSRGITYPQFSYLIKYILNKYLFKRKKHN